jgi:hypothetical protein
MSAASVAVADTEPPADRGSERVPVRVPVRVTLAVAQPQSLAV